MLIIRQLSGFVGAFEATSSFSPTTTATNFGASTAAGWMYNRAVTQCALLPSIAVLQRLNLAYVWGLAQSGGRLCSANHIYALKPHLTGTLRLSRLGSSINSSSRTNAQRQLSSSKHISA